MDQSHKQTRVCLTGACGRVGAQLSQAFGKTSDIELVHAINRTHAGKNLRDVVGSEAPDILISSNLEQALRDQPVDVLVDFTHQSVAVDYALTAIKQGVAPIIGTSGIMPEDQIMIRKASEEYGVAAMVVPNFAISVLLMMKFSELAAKWLPEVEILEMHSDHKADAPSGTAYYTAERIAAARQVEPQQRREILNVPSVRGGVVQSVPIHSVRLKGFMASQQVIFGSPGERLTIASDTLDQSPYVEGVKLAVRKIRELSGFAVGLDCLLFKGAD